MNKNDIIIKKVILDYIKKIYKTTSLTENYLLPKNFFDVDNDDVDKSYNKGLTYKADVLIKSILTKGFFKLVNEVIDFNPNTLSNAIVKRMFAENMLDDYYSYYLVADTFDEEVNENVYTEHPELAKKKVKIDRNQKPSPVKVLTDVLQKKFHIEANQFRTTDNNGVETVKIFDISDWSYSDVWINIANKEYELSEAVSVTNLHILDLICALYGYERVMTADKELPDGKRIISVIYHPVKPMKVVDSVKSCGMPVHFSPACNHDSIMENGIQTFKGERNYVYDDARAYYYLGYGYEDDKSFMKMLGGMAKSYKKFVNPDFDGIYNIYEVWTRNLDETIDFYWDPNCVNCVYTNEVIKPKRIRLIGTVDMSNPKRPVFNE